MLFFGANSWTQENLGRSGFSIEGLQAWALSGEASHTVLLWGAVALFCACIGKSGQFPLHTWLPDAMAGPTPVSSLLHSSTMVVAGVFLVARLYPVFWEAFSIPDVSVNFIVVIAAITIVISALLAFVQNDIKKVLAYSTVGQLGYMMLGLGAGAWLPAVFHIFTHAFFKCCPVPLRRLGQPLRLAPQLRHEEGHGRAGQEDADHGDVLDHRRPRAGGVFPLAGFFSKDEIIDNVGHNGYETFMWIALVGAFLTAAYTVRATYLTFFGEARGAAAVGEEHHVSGLGAALSAHDAPHDVQQEGELEDVERRLRRFRRRAARGGRGPRRSRCPRRSRPRRRPPAARVAEADPHPHLHPGRARRARRVRQRHAVRRAVGELQGVRRAPARRSCPRVRRGRGRRSPRRRRRPPPTRARRTGAAAEEAEEHVAAGCGHEIPEESAICYFPAVDHAEFKWSKAALSLIVVAAGLVSSWFVCVALYTKRSARLVGLTERSRPARWGYIFLANKYYLDALYEGVIVRAIAHPIAKARTGSTRTSSTPWSTPSARRARTPVACSTATSTRRSSTGPSRAPARSPTRPAPHCNPCSPARSASTAVCSSAPPPWAPSCS